MNFSGLKIRKSHTYTHTHIHPEIKFLDVLDYSEYSTNISKFFFHENIASSVRKQKWYENKKKLSRNVENLLSHVDCGEMFRERRFESLKHKNEK